MAQEETLKAPWRGLLHLLWRAPLFALPFAAFFGTLAGARWPVYVQAYEFSLVFSYCISFSYWALDHLVLPRLRATDTRRRQSAPWMRLLPYMATGLFGSGLAAVIIHLTLAPGFLGSGQAVASLVMFSLLFTVLGTSLAYAIRSYRQAIERARAEQEMAMARRIQRGFLLSQFPAMPRLEVHALNVSSREVSGDFYDVVPAGDDAFLLAIADVAGKGVPAALLSSMLQASLRTQANTVRSTAQIVGTINVMIERSTAPEQFATLFVARVDESRLQMSYCNAGHNYPIVFRRDGSQVALDRGGTVVGIVDGVAYEEGTIALEPGDRVLFYTDGISEAEDPRGDLYGEERLYALLRSLPGDLSARAALERVLAGVRGHLAGAEAGDDMTLMLMRVLEDEVAPASKAAAAARSVRAAGPGSLDVPPMGSARAAAPRPTTTRTRP